MIQISQTANGDFQAQYVWQAKRATSSFGTPLAHDGHAYFVNRSGVVYCLDLETGKEKYAERTADSTWATPIGNRKSVYLFGKGGTTTVIQSGDQFKKVAENPLASQASSGSVLYAAAIAGTDIILRRGSRLYKISD